MGVDKMSCGVWPARRPECSEASGGGTVSNALLGVVVPAEDDRRRRADTSLVGGERPYGARAATFFASSSPPLTVEVARLRHRLVEFVLGPAAEAVQQLPDHTGIGHRPPPLLGGAPGGLRPLGKPSPDRGGLVLQHRRPHTLAHHHDRERHLHPQGRP
jgi:hypothetical protein